MGTLIKTTIRDVYSEHILIGINLDIEEKYYVMDVIEEINKSPKAIDMVGRRWHLSRNCYYLNGNNYCGFISKREAARRLSVSEKAIDSMVENKEITKINSENCIDSVEVDLILASRL